MANSVNLNAFLRVIRHCEGTAGENGYRTIFGGTLFDSFEDHPRIAKTYTVKGKKYTSTAAGAYQFLSSTWDGLVRQYGFKDFSPENQDKGAIALIKGRGALGLVEAGKFEEAVFKCNKEWASLPGSPYGQPVKTLAFCKEIYTNNGGTYSTTIKKEEYMAPFIAAALPSLLSALPTLVKMFGSGTAVSDRNVAAVETAANVISKAVEATNIQEATERIQGNPEEARKAELALQSNYWDIMNLNMEEVKEARDFNLKLATSQAKIIHMPAFWITVLLLPLLYGTVYFTLAGPVEEGFSSELKAAVVSSIVTGILGGVIGFWLGSSFTTSKSRGMGAEATT